MISKSGDIASGGLNIHYTIIGRMIERIFAKSCMYMRVGTNENCRNTLEKKDVKGMSTDLIGDLIQDFC